MKLLLTFIVSLYIFTSFGQDSPEGFPKKVLKIYKTAESIKVDGLLNETVWKTTDITSDFYIQSPIDGELSKKQTEVMVTYDDRNLYIAARIFDDKNYVITTLKRDNFGESDDFAVTIDPQNRNQNGFAFGVNALGSPSEALMSPNNADTNWDNKWFSATMNYEEYWTVEFAIPFKTLRFKSENDIWGINFMRLDPGSFETHVWSPVPRQFDPFDLGYYGDLIWDELPDPQGKNIALIPYTSARIDRNADAETPMDYGVTVGADAKIALTTGLNLDLTGNPDFSQVDVDQQVTNLTRFSIFFPERRQFFLENGDIFNNYGQFGTSPFYSRRIGLDPAGRTVPILAGARLTGNLNSKLRLGTFTMQTAGTDISDGQNYSALNFQQSIGARSTVSGMFLNRQAFGTEGFSDIDYGRNAGGQINLSTKNGVWSGHGALIHSFKEGITERNNHIYGGLTYNGQNFRAFGFLQNIGRDYYADMGFNARVVNYDPINDEIIRIGFTQFSSMIDYYIYPESEKVNFHWSGLENFVYVNEGGKLNEWYTRVRHFIFFKNSSQLRFRLNNNYVDLIFPFALTNTPLPVGQYNMTEFNVQYVSDQRKLLNYEIFAVYGQFYNGTKLTYTVDLNYRVQPWGRFILGLERNEISLPDPYGKLNLTLANARIDINFSTTLFWTTFLQFNTQNSNFNLNSRIQWRYAPMSDLFLVYNDNYLVEDYFGPKTRNLVLKLNYWLGL